MSSKALATLVSYAALASVHPQSSRSDNLRPSSKLTCLWSGLRSLLLPTMTMGTDSVPCGQAELALVDFKRRKQRSDVLLSYQVIQYLVADDLHHLEGGK
jgi:hypothetical protein